MILTQIEADFLWIGSLTLKQLKITKWIFESVSSIKNELKLQHFNDIMPYLVNLWLLFNLHTHTPMCPLCCVYVHYANYFRLLWTHAHFQVLMILLQCSRLSAALNGWFAAGKTTFICFEVYGERTVNVVNGCCLSKVITFHFQRYQLCIRYCASLSEAFDFIFSEENTHTHHHRTDFVQSFNAWIRYMRISIIQLKWTAYKSWNYLLKIKSHYNMMNAYKYKGIPFDDI